MGTNPDNLFGRIALKNELLSPKQLVECLAIKDKLKRSGRMMMLGQIMIERGYLTRDEVYMILRRQKKAILCCPICKTKYNVEGFKAGKRVKCRICRTILDVPRDGATIMVDRTIYDSKTQVRDRNIGREIYQYNIERKLGEGGMGQVYLARHRGLDKLIALKLLPITKKTTREVRERFIREARIVARISHPNVVQVFDVGEVSDYLYIAMEYVDGETMENIMTHDHMVASVEATRIVTDVCQALKRAHRHEIVHRDIKPDNIMITHDEHMVKVTDFGLAKAHGKAKRITRVGVILGTPYYISPEQVEGKPVDIRTDIYSLGASYYYFVTGHRPFEEGTPPEIMIQHVEEVPIPPDYVNPEVPRVVNDTIMRMLAKSPDDRYTDPDELLADLLKVARAIPE
jgi:serine/threonine protein kinase